MRCVVCGVVVAFCCVVPCRVCVGGLCYGVRVVSCVVMVCCFVVRALLCLFRLVCRVV